MSKRECGAQYEMRETAPDLSEAHNLSPSTRPVSFSSQPTYPSDNFLLARARSFTSLSHTFALRLTFGTCYWVTETRSALFAVAERCSNKKRRSKPQRLTLDLCHWAVAPVA